jgi:zinc ribbon protein
LATQPSAPPPGTVFCRECGKAIEAEARFCRFCGKSQVDKPGASASPASAPRSTPPASSARTAPSAADGLETWLRQLFPRHQLQDEFMHVGLIATFLLALIGFVLGFFFAFNFLAVNFLLASVALSLFLMLRESTLNSIRSRGVDAGAPPVSRSPAARTPGAPGLPSEAATTQSSPPSGRPSAGQK